MGVFFFKWDDITKSWFMAKNKRRHELQELFFFYSGRISTDTGAKAIYDSLFLVCYNFETKPDRHTVVWSIAVRKTDCWNIAPEILYLLKCIDLYNYFTVASQLQAYKFIYDLGLEWLS